MNQSHVMVTCQKQVFGEDGCVGPVSGEFLRSLYLDTHRLLDKKAVSKKVKNLIYISSPNGLYPLPNSTLTC